MSYDKRMVEFLGKVAPSAIIPPEVSIWGTKYNIGEILIIKKPDAGELDIGVIFAIAVINNEVIFGCEGFKAFQNKNNVYVTHSKLNNIVIEHANLADFHPLVRHGTPTNFMFVLHNYITQ